MGNSFKKVFSTFVSLVTITWSVGAGSLAFPVSAQAATLNAGDLIKASGPSVYFYANDGKRYVFPNEKTYFSWFSDFSSVTTITDAELAAIPLGRNVTIRPGTKLVKITTDPKTYAVTKCGTLHWVESESVAKALYGDAWATRVVDVPDSFFENYQTGSSIATNVHPDGQLVTYAGDSARYVVLEGKKRKIADDSAFNANHWNMINSVVTSIVYPTGTDVTGAELDNFWTVTCTGSTPTVSGNVTVSLASDTPSGATVPKNAMSVPMVKVNLAAGSSDALVSGLRFHRVGVGAVGDFSNVYLYDQNGTRLTTGRSVNATTNNVEFNSLNITIPANGMKSFYVYADFSNPGTTGGNHAFELVDAASVVLTGTGTVSGSFPVRGNVFVVGTASAGTITIAKGAQPANPNIGAKDVEISNFKLTANTNDIRVNRVTLYNGGSINNTDLTNMSLYQGTTKVASAASVNAKGQIVLNFDTPYLIPNGVTRVFSLRGDVAGRANETIVTYVEYATDIMATDAVYNSGASVDISAFDSAAKGITVTTQGGQLTFAFNGPVASNIAKGRLGVQIMKFSLTSPDNDLEIRNLRMKLDAVSAAARLYVGTTPFFRNIKIVDTKADKTILGPKELVLTSSDDNQDFIFNETFTIKAGETMDLALVADLANNDNAAFIDEQYRGIFLPFVDGDVKVVTTGENLSITKIVPNAQTNGSNMTVKASSLTVALSSTPTSETMVQKSQDKSVLGITLTAGSQSDITVTNVNLKCSANIANAGWNVADCDQRVTSLALYDGATKVGLARSPDTTTGEAAISNMNLTIPKGTTKTLTVKATLGSGASVPPAVLDKFVVGLANGTTAITAQDQDANTIDFSAGGISQKLWDNDANGEQFNAVPSVVHTIIKSGSVVVAADSHPASAIVIGDGSDNWVPFAKYKATAAYEDMLIDMVRVQNLAGGDNANFKQVGIRIGADVKGATVFDSGTTGAKEIELSAGNEIRVPKGSSVNFELVAQLSDVMSSTTANGSETGVTRTGHAPKLSIDSNIQDGQWNADYNAKLNIRTTGASSSELVYFASGDLDANAQIIRATKPTVTMMDLSDKVFAGGQTKDLYRMQIGANAAGSVKIKQIIFNVSKTAGAALSNMSIQKGSSDMATGDYFITRADNGDDLKNVAVAAGVNNVKVVVNFVNGEDIPTGSGVTYSLRATLAGGDTDSVQTSLYRDTNTASFGRAYLACGVAFAGFANNANICHLDEGTTPGGRPDGAAERVGSFVWSDISELYHYNYSQGSYDWFNDILVEDLSKSSSLN